MDPHRILIAEKACPDCDERGGLALQMVLVAKRDGKYSIAGAQPKVAAESKVQLSCSLCGTSRIGRLEGVKYRKNEDGTVIIIAGHFVQEV